MKTRAKSALIMAPLLVIVFLGGYFLVAGVVLLTVFALREFCTAFGEKKPARWVLWTSLCILYACFFIPGFDSFVLFGFWLFASLVLCFLSMFAVEKRDLAQGMTTILGVVYIIFLSFHIVLVDNAYGGSDIVVGVFRFSGLDSYVWLIALAAFGTDIFAYFTGKAIGSHKLCPSISPKKTVEGAIGGVLGSVLLCGLFGYFFIPGGLATCIIIGVLGGIVSQLGDLSASVMKRKIGIKDWGAAIPGHGGILDRIDSVLFTAPLVFYVLAFTEAFGSL
ncbi:MAG: phosphatidate cytidylyltransferase [Clostridiales bacterium]|nr:phosphatidate cytidylyltransferase [Clostridiales bacterium]